MDPTIQWGLSVGTEAESELIVEVENWCMHWKPVTSKQLALDKSGSGRGGGKGATVLKPLFVEFIRRTQ